MGRLRQQTARGQPASHCPVEARLKPFLMWIDSHCHLQFGEIGTDAISRAKNAGVQHLICVGTDATTSKEAVNTAVSAGEGVSAVIGLHPHDAIQGVETILPILSNALELHPEKVVGIGECGLDYYYEHSPRIDQKKAFIKQIALCHEFGLTLVIHTRDAWDDTFEILRSEGIPPRTVVHCFTGGKQEAEIALELGLYLSFSGIVTFKNSTNLQEAARFCPLDRMLVETDSPFLAPVPFRGRPNEPALVKVVGEFLSRLKEVDLNSFSETVSNNTKRVFDLRF